MAYFNRYGAEYYTLNGGVLKKMLLGPNIFFCVGTPKVRKKTMFLGKTSTTPMSKNIPFRHFFGHRCVASHVASDIPPPPPMMYTWGLLHKTFTGEKFWLF